MTMTKPFELGVYSFGNTPRTADRHPCSSSSPSTP